MSIHTSSIIRMCKHPGCDRHARKWDRLCSGHQSRQRAGQPMDPPFAIRQPNVMSLRDRVEAGVSPSGECLVWSGRLNKHGYGRLTWRGREYLAHRAAYEVYRGVFDASMMVCHHCDNPPCCNPDHLFLGTQADNNRDKGRKGRQARGTSHGHAKLTVEAVLEIRNLGAAGVLEKDIAARFGVRRGTVSDILCRKTWTHV